jgi:ADP-ribose pyrophosphatase YjhB (NUDIX family)
MNFKEEKIIGVLVPILIPEHFSIFGIVDGQIHYKDNNTNKEDFDEPLFLHDETRIILNQFRTNFENDSVIVILMSSEGNIFLHRRSPSKKWEPNKLDLASIAGQRRAIFNIDKFENEEITETALREISEETGVSYDLLKKENLYHVGIHHNPHTKEYQNIFLYKINVSLDELNNNLKASKFDEISQWFEQDYKQTIDEYFGDGVHKYAGGEEMRPVNFISDNKIKEKLDSFFIM